MVAGSSEKIVRHERGEWLGGAAFHREGAYWDSLGGRLHSVDMLSGDILTLTDRGETRTHIGEVAALVRRRTGGGFIAATERGFALLDDAMQVVSSVPVFDDPSVRMNEGACDAQGRLFCGSMAYDYRRGAGRLYRLDRDLSVHVVLDSVTIPNALVWVDGGAAALHADTSDDAIYRYAYDVGRGTFGEREVFVDFSTITGSPDGFALDAEGGIWVALWGGAAVHRYDRHGALTDVVPLAVSNPTSCAIGGPSGTTLYVTTSRQGIGAHEQPEAGRLYAIDIGVQGGEVFPFRA